VEPGEADVLVWLERGPAGLESYLHPGVAWVQLPVAGVEAWMGDPVLTSGPVFTSARGAYSTAVAEHALALLLAGSRRLPAAARSTSWHRPDTRMLTGAAVVIVGAGGIGIELMRYLEPFGCRIIAVNRSGDAVDGADETLPVTRLDDACGMADHIVLAAPATPATEALIGADQLARMSPGAWIVNIGRGSLIDTVALTTALAAGAIGGAALDVTEPEPLPADHPLWSEPRCLITSHSANPREARLAALADRVAENLTRYANGVPLIGPIDPVAGF
jgi:phosphoglycerate dehydrogenase-like enzyme